MSGLVECVDTSRVPRSERLALWGQSLTKLSGGFPGAMDSFQVEGFDDVTIDGHIEKTNVGDLTVCRIEVGPHRVAQRAVDQGRGINVLLQICGSSIFEQGGRRVEVSAGDCLVGDFSQTREIMSPRGTKHLLILVPWRVALSYGLKAQNISFSSSRGLGRLNRNLVETVIEDRDAIDAEHERYLADTVMRSLQLSLAGLGGKIAFGARERLVQRVKSFVNHNLRDPDLDIGKVAAALGCSERYLHAAFANEGGTIGRYIWSTRLELCRDELARTTRGEKSVTDIAFAYGFNSSSHFSRTFKQKFGLPPSKMRG